MIRARPRPAASACSLAALVAALASPAAAQAQAATEARCDDHPSVSKESVDQVLEARQGLRAFEHERAQAEAAAGPAPGIAIPDAPDTGGGECVGPLARVEAIGAITYHGTQHCTGTLIAPGVVLTAAHCVDRFDATHLEFRVGPDARERREGRFAKAHRARVHGWYLPDRLGWNDVAVLYLAEDLKDVAPLAVRTEAYGARPPNQLVFVGYGNPGSDVPGRRRCLQLPVTHLCGKSVDVKALSVALESFDYHEPDRATCRGDSGGAALEARGAGYVLGGLTSWGAADCAALGISMDVGAYADFIGAAILDAPPRPNPHEWMLKWSPVAAATTAAVFGTYAILQLREQGDRRDDAARLIRADGTLTDPVAYNRALADANDARVNARQAGYWAAASLVLTGISSYVSYRITGDFGPFRF